MGKWNKLTAMLEEIAGQNWEYFGMMYLHYPWRETVWKWTWIHCKFIFQNLQQPLKKVLLLIWYKRRKKKSLKHSIITIEDREKQKKNKNKNKHRTRATIENTDMVDITLTISTIISNVNEWSKY